MHKNTEVAVFILNYNTSTHTINCVKSVLAKTSDLLDLHIYVVDNGSEKQDCDNLNTLQSTPNVTLLKSDKNLGFLGGYSLVFNTQKVTAEYFYFLNNDCLLINDTIKILVDFMSKNTNVGICSGSILSKNLEFEPCFNHLPRFSRFLFGSKALRILYPKKLPNRQKVYTTPLKVETVSGSSFMMSKDSYNAIGGFDTHYFLYLEEEELGFAMQKQGLDVYSVPAAKFQHLGGMSTKKSFESEREYFISLDYFFKKNKSIFSHYGTITVLFIKYLIKGIFNSKNRKIAVFLIKKDKQKYSLRYF